jgi:SSS family solute:Na+ symporter
MGTVILWTVILLVVLNVAFILAGVWFGKMAISDDDFMLAGRGVPFWLMASAYLGAYVGGASVSGYVSTAFNVGISGMWTSLAAVTGCTAFILLMSRRLNYFGRKNGAVTVADFVCVRYGESLRIPVAIASFVRPAFTCGMQYLAIAVAANVIFGVELKYAVVASAVIILLYLITAGQYSALVTQWFQSILQSAGILIFGYAAIRVVGDPTYVTKAMFELLDPILTTMWSIDPSMFSVWALTFGLFYLVDPWMYMWAYIGKTPKDSSNAMLSIVCGSYYNVLPFVAGLAILLGSILGNFTIPTGLSGDSLYSWFSVTFMSPFLSIVVLVGLFMTILSAGSTQVMSGVNILTRDIYQRVINKKATNKQSIRVGRLGVVLVSIVGVASALWLPDLIPLWALSQAIVISGLLPPVLGAWFWKRSTTPGAIASCIIGAAAAFSFAVFAWITTGSPGSLIPIAGIGIHAAHVGLLLGIPAMIVVSLLTKPEYDKVAGTNWKILGEEMKTSSLNPHKVTRRGPYGWLGADTVAWKVYWAVTLSLFALHYVLTFWFHIETFAITMVWMSLIVGVLMLIVLIIFGTKDMATMAKSRNIAVAAQNSAQQNAGTKEIV